MRANHWLACVLFLVGFCCPAAAEDFQPKLDRIGNIDPDRRAPEFSVDKVLDKAASRARSTPKMPLKQYQIHMKVDGFGSVHLGSSDVAGPDPEGKTWRAGVDEQSVRAGWLKDAPDLLLVVWLEVPSGRGNTPAYYCCSAIVRIAEGGLSVLHRARGLMSCRSQDFTYEIGVRSLYFTYDAETRTLTQKISRYTELWSAFRHGLYRAEAHWQDEGYLAVIRESLVRKWEYADGKLVHHSVELFYKTQERVTLTDIARFYLGPWARRRVILDANPDLAARYKDQHPGGYIYPPPGAFVRIPVPEDWLRDPAPL